MDISTTKKCVVSTKNGQLQEVLSILDGRYGLLNAEEGVRLVVCVCNACVDAQTQTRFTPEEVVDLVVNCTKTFEELSSTLMHTFLASIFHIIKYLGGKDDYRGMRRLAPDLIRILRRNFIGNDLITLIRNIYKIIQKIIVSDQSRSYSDDVLELYRFSIEILCRTKKLVELVQDEVLECFRGFSYYQVNLKYQREIYMYILQQIRSEVDVRDAPCYFQGILNLLSYLLQNFMRDNHIAQAKELISCGINIFKDAKIEFTYDLIYIIENVMAIMCVENDFPMDLKPRLSTVYLKFHKLCSDKKFIQSVSAFPKFLYGILYYSMQCFKAYRKQFWTNFKIDDLGILTKFILLLGSSLSRIPTKCKTCDNCLLQYDLFSATSVSIIPIYILRYCITNENKFRYDPILKYVNKCLDLSCTMIGKMQELHCNNWKILWTETGTLMYNLSVVFYRAKDVKAGFYVDYFIRKKIFFEGVDSTILMENILSAALLNLTECYLTQKETEKAMLHSAFNILLFPDDGEPAFLQWIRIKASEKENEALQNINLSSIIFDNEDFLLSLYPGLKLTNEIRQKLLQFELRQYKKIWPSKVSVTSAFKELYSFADTLVVTKEMVLMWEDGDNTLPIDLYEIIFSLVQKLLEIVGDNPEDLENKFNLASVYFIQYQVAYRKIQQKNREDMQAGRVESSDKQPTYDKNDECDLATWYESLKIDRHGEVMEYLKKSLIAFKALINDNNKKVLIDRNVYLTLNRIADEFLLQSYTLEYIESWLLCYRIGKILNDKICIIESIGNLLEESDLNAKFIKEALIEAEELILEVNDDKDGRNEKDWKVLMSFYISRGLILLNYGDPNRAIKCFGKAKEIYSMRDELKKCELLRIRFEFFEWRLQLLPCSFTVEGHTSVLSKPYLLIESISQYYKINGCNTYVLCILFKIFSSVVHMYSWLRQPREVRCYGRDIIILTQELVIPFSTIRLLSELADADLLSVRINDCYVKMKGICDILGHSENLKTNCLGEPTKSIAIEMNAVTDSFQEMMLDIPSAKTYREDLSGSPILLKDSFKIPSFLQHENSCECFYCLSIDYQKCVLVQIALQANLCYCERNLEAAIDYYQGAVRVYQKIMENERSFRSKVEKILGVSIFPIMENAFKEIYCIILLGFANTLVRDDRFMSVSTELIGIMKKNPYFNIYLYSEALFQQLNYLSMKSDQVVRTSPHLSPIVDDTNTTSIETTPESKYSQVNLTSGYTPVTERKKTIRKVIKFDLSDTEDKEEVINRKPLSPRPYILQTPAVSTSKVKIYQPSSVRTTRKKKVAEKLDFTSERKKNVADPIVDLAQKPKDIQAKLKTQTKLLTEKLKKAPRTIPNIVVTNDSESDCENRPKTRARKNLMSELNVDNDNPTTGGFKLSNNNNSNNHEECNRGAIKKRTRSRKVL